MSDDQALPLPPDFDAWLDDSDHNALWLSIGDDCWQGIAYEMARAGYAAGRAQGAATEREGQAIRIRDLAEHWAGCNWQDAEGDVFRLCGRKLIEVLDGTL